MSGTAPGYSSFVGMRWANERWDEHPELSHRDKVILMTIARRANAVGVAFPTVETIGAACGVDPRHVRIVIRTKFEPMGLLKIRTNETGRRAGNSYELIGFNDRRMQPERDLFIEEEPDLPPDRAPIMTDGRGTPFRSGGAILTPRGDSGSPGTGDSGSPPNRTRIHTRDKRVLEAASAPVAASPPPAASAPPQVVQAGPAVNADGSPDNRITPSRMVTCWNMIAADTRILAHHGPLDRRLGAILARIAKHEAFAGDMLRFKAFIRWIARQPWLNGKRQGCYPADIQQAASERVITRWVAEWEAQDVPPASPARPQEASPPAGVVTRDMAEAALRILNREDPVTVAADLNLDIAQVRVWMQDPKFQAALAH